MVLTLVAILAATVGTRWPGGLFLRAQAEQLAQDVRYTQALAMGRGESFTMRSMGGHRYGIFDVNGTPLPPYPLTLEGQEAVIDPFSITFDAPMGSPGPADQTISLSMGGENQDLIVTGITGWVRISQ